MVSDCSPRVSSVGMAVSRVPSPTPQEGNTPVAESWCYTQVSSCYEHFLFEYFILNRSFRSLSLSSLHPLTSFLILELVRAQRVIYSFRGASFLLIAEPNLLEFTVGRQGDLLCFLETFSFVKVGDFIMHTQSSQ